MFVMWVKGDEPVRCGDLSDQPEYAQKSRKHSNRQGIAVYFVDYYYLQSYSRRIVTCVSLRSHVRVERVLFFRNTLLCSRGASYFVAFANTDKQKFAGLKPEQQTKKKTTVSRGDAWLYRSRLQACIVRSVDDNNKVCTIEN